MVQIVTANPDNSTNYWKLGRPALTTVKRMKTFLRNNNFHSESNVRKASAAELVVRCQRGLLGYESNNVAKLRLIAQDLNLVPTGTQSSSAEIIAAWKSYPEIDLRKRLDQPPLSLATRQLRVETLPVFYAKVMFETAFAYNVAGPKRTLNIRAPTKKLAFRPYIQHHFASMRQLHLTLELFGYFTDSCTFHIDLRPKSQSGRKPGVWMGRERKSYLVGDVEARKRKQSVANALSVFVGKLMRRPGAQKVQITNLRRFRGAIAKGLPRVDALTWDFKRDG